MVKQKVVKLPHISASQVSIFTNCGMKYKFKYIDGIKIPQTSPHIIFGIAIHKTLEEFHNLRINNKLETIDLYIIFDKQWNLAIQDSPIPVIINENQQKDLYKIGIIGLDHYYKAHHKDPLPLMVVSSQTKKPAIEVEFNVPIENVDGTIRDDFTLYGFMDLIQYLPKLGLCIIDHKTSTKYFDTFKISTDLQLLSYAYAFRYMLKKGYFPELDCETEDNVVFNVFIKNKEASVVQYSHKITQLDIIKFLYITNKMLDGIEHDIYLPSYGFTCKFCEYRDICQKYNFSKDVVKMKHKDVGIEEIIFDMENL